MVAAKQHIASLKFASSDLLNDADFMAAILSASIKDATMSDRWKYANGQLKVLFRAAIEFLKNGAPKRTMLYVRERYSHYMDYDVEEEGEVTIYLVDFDGTTLQKKVNKLKRKVYKRLWLQRQATASCSLPDDVRNHIHEFIVGRKGYEEGLIRQKCEHINNLERCMPIFVALYNRGKDWNFVDRLDQKRGRHRRR